MKILLKVLLLSVALITMVPLVQAAPFLPTGKYLVYADSSERNIMVLDAKGKKLRIIDNAEEPALSSDGEHIAFIRSEYVSTDDGRRIQSDIWIAETISGKEQRLTHTPDSEENPAWSPDGKKLAFGTRLQGHYGNGYSLLQLINIDGSNQHSITNNDGCSRPSWNPNGKQLCFVLYGQICRVDIDGKNRRKLTKTCTAADFPQYSPDGRWIIFSAGNDDSVTTRDGDRFGPILRGTDSILRISAAGEDAKHPTVNLTSSENDDDMPQYSADGKWIVFSSDRKDRASSPPLDSYDESAEYSRTLCVMDANGKNPKVLGVEGDAVFPSWR